MKAWAVLILAVFLLAGCANQQLVREEKAGLAIESRQEADISSNKVLFIIAQNQFRDEELSKPKQVLENAGYSVEVASITTELAKGMLGAKVQPDLAVKDAKAEDYALIVVVGGLGAPELANHAEVLSLLSQAKEKDIKLAAICLGPVVLAKAGVLQGKQATVYITDESAAILRSRGAILVDKSVVVDTDLVTANGPGAAAEFGNELVKLLQN
jgi:protease I